MRTIVVTGAASGMGAATKERLEADGHRVIGMDRQETDVVADLGTPEGRAAAVAAVQERVGDRLDGIVTAAGVFGFPGGVGDVVVSVNYFGTVALLDALRPLLARGTDPAAVVVSSNSITTNPSALRAVTDACLAGDEDKARTVANEAGASACYPASKVAVTWWARRNSPAWAADGITLNTIVPGLIHTPMVEQIRADERIGPLFDQVPIPVGRLGRPDEIASAAAFLLGPGARYICGSTLFVDGGTDALVRPDDPQPNWA
jgi:NAD(P)-dependent dehydrogenase (short-subunit alcohol dehydrogenase family)